jgi:GNAT superfamily N-acetyltransferase
MKDLDLTISPLTAERWDDLCGLFGARGASGGCWCMWWRLTSAEFEKQKGEGNRQAFKQIIDKGEIPGILAYDDNQAVGWCSLAPRESFPRLARSRILKPIDEQPVWSIVCFFVAKAYRRRGLTVQLLQAAIQFARDRGARIVEGYPVEPRQGCTPDAFAYTGLVSAFLEAGFKEVLRRSDTRPIMRYEI